jgi:hypothetical protein
MNLEFQSHSEAIYDYVQSYKKRVQKYGEKNCKESKRRLSELIRGLDCIRGANYASEQLLKETNVENPIGLKWNKRKEVGGLFEHSHPVVEIRTHLLTNDLSLEETLDYLWNDYAVCWITYEEDEKLRKLGYTKKRPNGWKKCYEEAGIKIVQK